MSDVITILDSNPRDAVRFLTKAGADAAAERILWASNTVAPLEAMWTLRDQYGRYLTRDGFADLSARAGAGAAPSLDLKGG